MKDFSVYSVCIMLCLTLNISGCSGKASSSSSLFAFMGMGKSAPQQLTYTSTSSVYTIGLPITDNVPSVTGSVESWTVSPELPDGLLLDSLTGVISGTPDTIQAVQEYIIYASNQYGTTSATISITVNLAPPTALSYATTSAVYTKDELIVDNIPTVTGTVTSWSVDPSLPSGLVIDSVTGIISGIPDAEQLSESYTITAGNAYGSTTTDITITVNLEAPSSLTYETTSAVYTRDAVIIPNEPTYSGTVTNWTVDPELPSGLNIDPITGIISGTPDTEQPVEQYIITAENSGGSTTTTLSITVNLAAPTSLSYSSPAAVYTKDLVIIDNEPTVTGTVTSWEVSPALPNGLTLNTSTGVITGAPDTEQEGEDYTITATNSGGSTTATINITVNLAAPSGLSYSTPAAVYTKDLVIIDNEPTVTGTVTSWEVSPALPNGLTLNTSTGVITGMPDTEQTAEDYTITATNSGGSTTTIISITVNLAAPSELNYSTPAAIYYIDSVISDNVPTITGSVVSWSVNPALPNGLTLNTTTGVISGTPDAEHAESVYTIMATNSGGSTTSAISITVNIPGASWYARNVPGSASTSCWYSIASSFDGMRLAAVAGPGHIYLN